MPNIIPTLSQPNGQGHSSPCMLGIFLLALPNHTQQNPTAATISLGSFLGRPIPKCTFPPPPIYELMPMWLSV